MIEKFTATLFLGSLVAVGVVVPSELTPELFMQWGLAGLVVALVMWRDWQREKRMSTSMEKQAKWIQETMLDALRSNTKAIDRCYHLQGAEDAFEDKK